LAGDKIFRGPEQAQAREDISRHRALPSFALVGSGRTGPVMAGVMAVLVRTEWVFLEGVGGIRFGDRLSRKKEKAPAPFRHFEIVPKSNGKTFFTLLNLT
jgi:hypothetical protein